MKKLFILMLAIGVLQGCATTSQLKLDPVASGEQKEIFQGGIKTLVSPKRSLVIIRASANSYQSVQRPSLGVQVTNGTEESYDFGPENIRVSVNGQSVKVFTYDELIAEVERKQESDATWAAINGIAKAMNAENAGYTDHSGTYDSSYYGSGYSGYGHGSYSGQTYDAAAVQQARSAGDAETRAKMAAIRTQTDETLNQVASAMLRKETIFPQQTFSGYILLGKLPVPDTANEVTINVSVGGESHQFHFMLTKVAK